MQKWIAIVALVLMPAVTMANICATGSDLAKLTAKPIATADAGSCDDGPCLYANLCDLAQAVFVAAVPLALKVEQRAVQAAGAPRISIPAEPEPPLKPPVV